MARKTFISATVFTQLRETYLWPIFWLPLRLARNALQFWKTWGSLVSWIVMSIIYLSSFLKNHQSSLLSSFGNIPPTDMSYLYLKDVWLVSAKFSECFQKSCKLALNMRSIMGNMEILEELSSEDNHITIQIGAIWVRGDAVNISDAETTSINSVLNKKEIWTFKIDFTFFIPWQMNG